MKVPAGVVGERNLATKSSGAKTGHLPHLIFTYKQTIQGAEPESVP
jgi:hypothetical protein